MSERDPLLEARVSALADFSKAHSVRLYGEPTDDFMADENHENVLTPRQLDRLKIHALAICTEVESAVRGKWVHDTSQHLDTPDPEPWDDESIERCVGKALVNNTSVLGNDPMRRLHDVQSVKATLTQLGINEVALDDALARAFKGMAEGKYND